MRTSGKYCHYPHRVKTLQSHIKNISNASSNSSSHYKVIQEYPSSCKATKYEQIYVSLRVIDVMVNRELLKRNVCIFLSGFTSIEGQNSIRNFNYVNVKYCR